MYVAVQFGYVLRAAVSTNWRFASGAAPGAAAEGDVRGTAVHWGPCRDPIAQLSLYLQWEHRRPREDSAAFSEYDALSASRWMVRAGFRGDCGPTLLSEAVRSLLRAWRDAAPFSAVAQVTGSASAPAARARSVNVHTHLPEEAPCEAADVGALVDAVFSAARARDLCATPPSPATPSIPGVHGAPFASLLERLALTMLSARSLAGYLHIWSAFLARVRAHAAEKRPLPGVSSEPLFQTNIIDQRLALVCFLYLSYYIYINR